MCTNCYKEKIKYQNEIMVFLLTKQMEDSMTIKMK